MSVVVVTRDRGERIVETIRTTLRNQYPRFDVTIVDQSADGGTRAGLRPYLGDPRVAYLPTSTSGLTAGRNDGIEHASGPLIALTDDDCAVASDWLQHIVRAFKMDSRIGIIFGNVLPAPHDRTAGFIPAYVRSEPFLARDVRSKDRIEGIGACMALRRAVWEALGGFDEALGAGAPFKAGDEGDLAIRALQAGYFVYETPALAVVHHGFRTWEEGRELIHNYWYGTGAMFAKHFRHGETDLVPVLARLAAQWAFARSPVAASLGARRHRFSRLASFARGLLAAGVSPAGPRSRRDSTSSGRSDGTARIGSHPDS